MPRKKLGTMCSTGCPTKDHETWGACVRAKNARIAYANSANGSDFTAQKRWDNELAEYRNARAQGIQPDGTTFDKIRKAVDLSDRFGAAYGRDFNAATPMEA